MDVPVRIMDIKVSKDQVIFTVEYVFQGQVETFDVNLPASRFKGKTVAEIEQLLRELFTGIIKTRVDSDSEIANGEWINKAKFIGKQFIIVI